MAIGNHIRQFDWIYSYSKRTKAIFYIRCQRNATFIFHWLIQFHYKNPHSYETHRKMLKKKNERNFNCYKKVFILLSVACNSFFFCLERLQKKQEEHDWKHLKFNFESEFHLLLFHNNISKYVNTMIVPARYIAKRYWVKPHKVKNEKKCWDEFSSGNNILSSSSLSRQQAAHSTKFLPLPLTQHVEKCFNLF